MPEQDSGGYALDGTQRETPQEYAARHRFFNMADRARRAQAAVDEILGKAPASTRTLPPVVGIGGWPEAGKTELAGFLENEHGYRHTFTSEDLANTLYVANPWIRLDVRIDTKGKHVIDRWYEGDFVTYQDLVDVVGYTGAKRQREVREWLKRLGNDIGREMFSETLWVDKLQARIAGWIATGESVVVTGIRYRNDLELIDAYEGLTVWVDRPGIEGSSHRSDTELTRDDFRWALTNDGPLDYLREQARLIDAEARNVL